MTLGKLSLFSSTNAFNIMQSKTVVSYKVQLDKSFVILTNRLFVLGFIP